MAVRKDHQNQSRWQRMSPEAKARRLAQMRQWQQANPEKVKQAAERRRAKLGQSSRTFGYGNFERAKKYDFVRQQKIERGQCADCGFYCDDITHVCFAWDHIEPQHKAFNLSKAHRYTWQEIIDEIAKCELVCHNCHAIRTYLEGHNRTERNTNPDQPSLF